MRPCLVLLALLVSCTVVDAAPMRFLIVRSDQRAAGHGIVQAIYATGEIVPGTADTLDSLLNGAGVAPGSLLVLDSGGGALVDSLVMGNVIRWHGLVTMVGRPGPADPQTGLPEPEPGSCLSACTLAFLGGAMRYAGPYGSRFGVHQFFSSITQDPSFTPQAVQTMSGLIYDYVRDMGVDSQFLVEMARALPGKMNLLSPARMAQLGVTTR